MASNTLPRDEECRAFMHRLRAFRDSLSEREQRMLDAVVLASFWPGGQSAEVQGYRLLPMDAIWGDDWQQVNFQSTPWAATLLSLPFYP